MGRFSTEPAIKFTTKLRNLRFYDSLYPAQKQLNPQVSQCIADGINDADQVRMRLLKSCD